MTQPLISVIVPCYNQAQYLDECLQSVLDQTYENWECIIVNDGSPDHTEEVARLWVEKDSRFKYLYKENGGLSSARNAGIEIATGEWILPLDSDDKIGAKYMQLAAKKFDEDFTIIYCEAEFFGEKNIKWDLPVYSYRKILINNIIFCSAFFKKKYWQTSSGYDQNLKYGREDWDFWLSILDDKKKIFRISYCGFYYRRKENSMDTIINEDSMKMSETKKYIFIKHYDKYEKMFGNYFDLVDELNKQKDYNALLLDLTNESVIKKIKRKLFK